MLTVGFQTFPVFASFFSCQECLLLLSKLGCWGIWKKSLQKRLEKQSQACRPPTHKNGMKVVLALSMSLFIDAHTHQGLRTTHTSKNQEVGMCMDAREKQGEPLGYSCGGWVSQVGRCQHKTTFFSQAIGSGRLLGTVSHSCGFLSREQVIHY